jgi:hypothetical protein
MDWKFNAHLRTINSKRFYKDQRDFMKMRLIINVWFYILFIDDDEEVVDQFLYVWEKRERNNLLT